MIDIIYTNLEQETSNGDDKPNKYRLVEVWKGELGK